MRAGCVALALLAGCAGSGGAPCAPSGDPAIFAGSAEAGPDAFADGDPFLVAIPPQGGAPFTPLEVRIEGLAAPQEGLGVEVFGEDRDSGEDLGTLELGQRFLCANVGDNAGRWVAPELHFRYPGWELDQLYDRAATFLIVVTDAEGTEVQTERWGVLRAP